MIRQPGWKVGLLFLSVCLSLTACGRKPPSAGKEGAPPSPAAGPSTALPAERPEGAEPLTASALSADQLGWRIKTPQGNMELRAEPRPDGFKLFGGTGQFLGQIKVEADRLKIKDAQDQIVWKIKQKEDGCKLYDANDREVFQVKRHQGGYRIKDINGRELGAIKPKNAGSFKIYNAEEREVGKAKPKNGEVELEDAKGQTVARFSGQITPLAASFWRLEGFDLLQRAGLVVFQMKFE